MILNEILNENAENAADTMDMPVRPGLDEGELRPLSREEFLALTPDAKRAYILALREKYHIGNNELAEILSYPNPRSASSLCRRLGLPVLSSGQQYHVDRLGYEAWMESHGRTVRHKMAYLPTTGYRPSETPKASQTRTRARDAAPTTQTITYRGALSDVATMLSALGAVDAGVRNITVSWT